jgi:hypothetical protein
VRLPASRDTRLLLAGIAAVVALVAYLGVAFVDTHASIATATKVAPWTPHSSELVPIPLARRGKYAVRVNPTKQGSYGALVSTLLAQPPDGRRFTIHLTLKGARGDPIGVVVDEFRPGATSVYVVNTTVPAMRRWHHFTFSGRVQGSWLGLGMYVYRQNNGVKRTWFALRGLTVTLGRGSA